LVPTREKITSSKIYLRCCLYKCLINCVIHVPIVRDTPQVNLHGMDEGLTLKMCSSILQATISEAKKLRKMNTTSVSISLVIACAV
jgi:hypothetical protein